MPTQDEHTKILDRLKAMLKRKTMTARQVAEEFDSSKPTAYQRIRALIARGDEVYELAGKADGTGPRPVAYGVR